MLVTLPTRWPQQVWLIFAMLAYLMLHRAGRLEAKVASPMEKMEVCGHSVRGRPLTAWVLGEGANVTAIFGAFHGNEATTKLVVEQLREYLRQHPDTLAGCEVVLMPNVNPDGIAAGTRVNAHGVDLNRNFPDSWQPHTTQARYYPGAYAGSEPETQAVIRLMAKYRPSKVISLHSPFHTMNWTGERGQALAAIMRGYNQYPTTDDIGYPTPGSFGHYCGHQLQIAIVTLELPVEPAAASWRANRAALLAAIALPPTSNLDFTATLQALHDQVRAGAESVYAHANSTAGDTATPSPEPGWD